MSNDKLLPTLYFDLGSPYAYLAIERAPVVLGAMPALEPVLLGAIFARRGFGSWSATPARTGRIEEIEGRARRYGLPPLRWPVGWPLDGLLAMRCATYAKCEDAVEPFARAVLRREFQHGEDVSARETLMVCAREAGLNAEAMDRAVGLAEVKDALRQATEAAWVAGVCGVPTLRVGEALFYGEDQLELAAAVL